MSIPENIRAVPIPTNIVVVLSGTGRYKYAVRERSGTKYDASGKAQPINGSIISHIIDGRYVPKEAKVVSQGVISNKLSYGGSALAFSVVSDIKDDLEAVLIFKFVLQALVLHAYYLHLRLKIALYML